MTESNPPRNPNLLHGRIVGHPAVIGVTSRGEPIYREEYALNERQKQRDAHK